MPFVLDDADNRNIEPEIAQYASCRVQLGGGAIDDKDPQQGAFLMRKPAIERPFQRPEIVIENRAELDTANSPLNRPAARNDRHDGGPSCC